jgi:hypothetical protein
MSETPLLVELMRLLNKHCAENRSNTPDFILAEYLLRCLNALDIAVNDRTEWHRPSEPVDGGE